MGFFNRKLPKNSDEEELNKLQAKIKEMSERNNPERLQVFNIFAVPDKTGYNTTCGIVGDKNTMTSLMIELCKDSKLFEQLIIDVYIGMTEGKGSSRALKFINDIMGDKTLPPGVQMSAIDMSDHPDQKSAIKAMLDDINSNEGLDKPKTDPSKFSGDLDSDD